MQLRNYCEYINTECDNSNSPILAVKALKLDGKNSLKESLQLANVKTCDYLRRKQGKALLIECSNLVRQVANESEYYNQAQQAVAGQDRQLRKQVEKRFDPESRIREEMRYKCIHSLLLLHRLADRLGFRLDHKFSNGVVFIIAICTESKADVMAFQGLVTKLKPTLQGIADSVKVVPANGLPALLA